MTGLFHWRQGKDFLQHTQCAYGVNDLTELDFDNSSQSTLPEKVHKWSSNQHHSAELQISQTVSRISHRAAFFHVFLFDMSSSGTIVPSHSQGGKPVEFCKLTSYPIRTTGPYPWDYGIPSPWTRYTRGFNSTKPKMQPPILVTPSNKREWDMINPDLL